MAKVSAEIKEAIKGLKFRESQKQESTDEDGRKAVQHVPVVRDLTEDDVLKTRVDEDGTLVIISGDGTKHRVKPKGKKEPA